MWLLELIVCVRTKEERMEGKRKMRDEEVEREGEWGSSVVERRKEGRRQRRWGQME